MSQQLFDRVDPILDTLVAFRQELHAHPELSWEETETTDRIARFLHDRQVIGFRPLTGTGGVVDLVFREGAPFILLRADIDALPLADEKTVAYRSTRPGVCHACGHDAHTTIVAGIGSLAAANRLTSDWNVRLVFQPAEEPIPSGAPEVIRQGVMENVALSLGMHMEPRLPLGTIGLTPGYINMQSIRLDLVLRGKGGHSARPYETADLLWLASRVIQESYQMIYREINLLDSAVVLTFTEIHAGEGYNVIPGELRMTGTLRLADPLKKERALEKLRGLLGWLEADSGASISLAVTEGSPAVYNDPDLTAELQRIVAERFGDAIAIDTTYRTPGGDDFSHYLENRPGVMMRIGIRERDDQPSLHEGTFDIPPEALRIGTAVIAECLAALPPAE